MAIRKMLSVAVVTAAFVVLSNPSTVVLANDDVVFSQILPQNPIATMDKDAVIWIIIRVKPHPGNRNLVFEWESAEHYGRKDETLNGESRPFIFNSSNQQWFGPQGFHLPPGQYTLTVTVERAMGDNPRTNTTILVRGRGFKDEGADD